MNYDHLLVPVDLSDPDEQAIQTALALAVQHHAQTTLLYVIEAIDNGDDDDETSRFYADLESRVRQKLSTIAAQYQQAGLPVRSEVVIGHGPREIIQYSATQSVDLIIMRSQRVDLSRPDRRVTSVSHQVSLFCQCPVMLVK